MSKTRVLVVDDASVVRGMLSKLINAEPDMEVAGTARDGQVGLDQADLIKPDIIVLDIDMPVLGGIEALKILRERQPATPVIMFSSMSTAGATITLEALGAGAADYSAKPTSAGSSAKAAEQVRQDLIPKIRALSPKTTDQRTDRPVPGPAPRRQTNPANRLFQPIDAILIGSSTGGPAALEDVLPGLGQDLRVPILMVQHMPQTFTAVLANRLAKLCPYPVHEARHGMAVQAGNCYLATGGQHMRVVRQDGGVRLALDEGPKIKSCRPAVDALFDSAAEIYGQRLVAAILTGMGDDGLDSCARLAANDVEIIAQDEATSVVWGMPGAVVKAGLADSCLPLADISKALVESATRRAPTRPKAMVAT